MKVSEIAPRGAVISSFKYSLLGIISLGSNGGLDESQ
jgi:hypothetical protein